MGEFARSDRAREWRVDCLSQRGKVITRMIEMTERQMQRVSEAFLTRVKAEYAAMPGLCLTVAQAARLWHVTTGTAEAALRVLVKTGYLRRRFDGVYGLTEGGFSRCAWFVDQ